MAWISATLPILKEAAAAMVKEYFHGTVPKDFDRLVSYTYSKAPYKVHIASRICCGKEWCGDGTVVLDKAGEIFVYKGFWHPTGNILVSSLESDLITFDGNTEKVKYLPDNVSFKVELDPYDVSNTADAADHTHVRCVGTRVEFPLVPSGELRMLGPDGDYLLLNEDIGMTKDEMEQNLIREEAGIKIYHITRQTLVRGLDGTGLEFSLTVYKNGAEVYWYDPNGCEKTENVEFSFFKYWLENVTAPRNLLRALGLKIPDTRMVVPGMPESDKVAA